MHRRQEVPQALLRLADCQSAVLSREQVLGHDVSSSVITRLIRSGTWQRLGNGLYLTHPLEPSWEALAWGGILLGGSRARLGPEASGYGAGAQRPPATAASRVWISAWAHPQCA